MNNPQTLEACVIYALGRKSYVAHWVASTVRAQWPALPPDCRSSILNLVEKALAARPTAGDATPTTGRTWSPGAGATSTLR